MKKTANAILSHLFFFVFLFAIGVVVNAQSQSKTDSRLDYDYTRFKTEFDKEFGIDDIAITDHSASNINRVFFKTKLPDWVFEFPSSNNSVVYAIGISEPGMSKDSAYLLATLRAKAVLSVIIDSKIQWLTDYYTSEKDAGSGEATLSSVYKEFNKITSTLSFNPDDFKIVSDTFTANNEAIVLASLRTGNRLSGKTESINCLSEVSSSYPNKNDKYFSTSRTEMRAGEKYASGEARNYFYYVVKKHNKQLKISSVFSGAPIPGNANRMTYQSDEHFTGTEELSSPSCALQNGLWYAFSSVLLQALVLDPGSEVNQSSMDDHYSELSQTIIRVSGRKEVSLKLGGLHVKNNTLYLKTGLNSQH